MITSPLNIDPLWCSWFTGFVDGEGYFQIMPAKNSLALTINLREDEREIVHEIWHTLGCGSVYHISNEHERHSLRGLKASDMWRWRVIKLSEIFRVIIPLFDAFPLRAKKSRDYMLWREAALLMGDKAHLSPEGLEKILDLHNRMKESHKGPYILHLEEQLD